MNSASAAVHEISSLKKIDPAKAELTNALLQLLGAAQRKHGIAVSATGDLPNAKVFTAGETTAFAILDQAANCQLGLEEDADHALDILDSADPLLKYAEQALNIKFDPDGISAIEQSAFANDDAIILILQSGDMSLQIAVAADGSRHADWLAAAALVNPDPHDIACVICIEFEAARLPVGDAAGIEHGDMLLLPQKAPATWFLQTATPASKRRSAVLDLSGSTLQITNQLYDQEEIGMADEERRQDASENTAPDNTAAAFTVPVTVRLPVQHFDAATLGALREGSSLSLVPLTQGLQVELLVGGRKIATGSIAEIGDNFAVIIEGKASALPMDEDAPEIMDMGE
jgi:flagellar motor switch/type III secretory pathway protein FliN